MTIDLFASLPHYAEHMRPVWDGLPPGSRGRAGSARPGCSWGAYPYRPTQPPGANWAMIAGASDRGKVRGMRLVLFEHGAGQNYVGQQNPSYAGGRGWDHLELAIVPGPASAEQWRSSYPLLQVAEVGAPWLDRWHGPQAVRIAVDSPPAVAVTFHWDCQIALESMSAARYYRPVLPGLVEWARNAGVRLLGHAHPRAHHAMRPVWEQLGVEWVPSLAEVLDRATVLVADNTSALYEFASTGRPVVCLNAPWYRRDVEHGLRFWSHVPGVQVDDRADLVEVIATTLAEPHSFADARARATARVYAATDGQATARAVAAITEVLQDAEPQEPEGQPRPA